MFLALLPPPSFTQVDWITLLCEDPLFHAMETIPRAFALSAMKIAWWKFLEVRASAMPSLLEEHRVHVGSFTNAHRLLKVMWSHLPNGTHALATVCTTTTTSCGFHTLASPPSNMPMLDLSLCEQAPIDLLLADGSLDLARWVRSKQHGEVRSGYCTYKPPGAREEDECRRPTSVVTVTQISKVLLLNVIEPVRVNQFRQKLQIPHFFDAYKLVGVTYYHDGHYTCDALVKNVWFQYDGMKNSQGKVLLTQVPQADSSVLWSHRVCTLAYLPL
jgi:hypothetical protein